MPPGSIFGARRTSDSSHSDDPPNNLTIRSPLAEQPWTWVLSSAIVAAVFVAFYPVGKTYQETVFALAIAAASMLIGVLLGFLFGVPHAVESKGDQAQRRFIEWEHPIQTQHGPGADLRLAHEDSGGRWADATQAGSRRTAQAGKVSRPGAGRQRVRCGFRHPDFSLLHHLRISRRFSLDEAVFAA